MRASLYYYDLILVPLSFSLTIGYHIFLWRSFKNKERYDTPWKKWSLAIFQDQEKKGMLAVQSLRNALMTSILSCTIAIAINTALAAISNNAYNGRRILQGSLFFGFQEGPGIALKYCVSSLLILSSFASSSVGIAQLIDAGFLLNVPPSDPWLLTSCEAKLECGCLLTETGNRLLFITIPLLFWMLGPTAMVLSSIAIVWLLYGMDFPGAGSV